MKVDTVFFSKTSSCKLLRPLKESISNSFKQFKVRSNFPKFICLINTPFSIFPILLFERLVLQTVDGNVGILDIFSPAYIYEQSDSIIKADTSAIKFTRNKSRKYNALSAFYHENDNQTEYQFHICVSSYKKIKRINAILQVEDFLQIYHIRSLQLFEQPLIWSLDTLDSICDNICRSTAKD